MSTSKGKVIIAPGINIWPHELKTAEALATVGYVVEFVRRNEAEHQTSADVIMAGAVWEMKAPKSDRADMIQKNLRRALHQSQNVIFDARRMKKLPDRVIEREVRIRAAELRTLRHLIYVNRKGMAIVIK